LCSLNIGSLFSYCPFLAQQNVLLEAGVNKICSQYNVADIAVVSSSRRVLCGLLDGEEKLHLPVLHCLWTRVWH